METEPAPAGLTLFGFPDEKTRTTRMEIHIPYVMGLIGTRSTDKVIPGIEELETRIAKRIDTGIVAVKTLEQLRKDPKNPKTLAEFDAVKADLGYGLLLKKYTTDVSQATPEMKAKAPTMRFPTFLLCSGHSA